MDCIEGIEEFEFIVVSCSRLSDRVQGTRVWIPLQTGPHPDKDASENISKSGSRGKNYFVSGFRNVGHPPLQIEFGVSLTFATRFNSKLLRVRNVKSL